jgi:Ca2+/Na+ antiporter
MGIVFGYLSLICFCMLVAKWIARRCIKFDKVLMRIHRPVSLLLIVFCILHISFCITVLRNRNILVNVSEVVAFYDCFNFFLPCTKTKRQKDEVA